MKGIARYTIHHIRRHAARKVATLVGMGFTEQQATVPWHHWVSQFYGSVPIWCPIKKRSMWILYDFVVKRLDDVLDWCSYFTSGVPCWYTCEIRREPLEVEPYSEWVGWCGKTTGQFGVQLCLVVFSYSLVHFCQCQRALLCIDDQHTPQWSWGSWL